MCFQIKSRTFIESEAECVLFIDLIYSSFQFCLISSLIFSYSLFPLLQRIGFVFSPAAAHHPQLPPVLPHPIHPNAFSSPAPLDCSKHVSMFWEAHLSPNSVKIACMTSNMAATILASCWAALPTSVFGTMWRLIGGLKLAVVSSNPISHFHIWIYTIMMKYFSKIDSMLLDSK